jgi:enamine deaminase RidA (YjgF/YER057c/UK114 family)
MSELKRIGGTARMSAAVIHGDRVYFKGVTSRGGPADIAGQTRDVLEQIDALLEEAGTSRDKLLQVMIWLSDISNFDAMNSVYDQWVVPGSQPVRACVEARLASDKLLIEVQVTAAR